MQNISSEYIQIYILLKLPRVMPRTLHIIHRSAPVRAVLITAKALDVDLNIDVLDENNLKRSLGYLKLNNQYSIPTLDDNGTIIRESHAINAYLVRKYGNGDDLYPDDFCGRALVDEMLFFDSGVLVPALHSITERLERKEISEISPEIMAKLDEAFHYLNKRLEEYEWVAGDHLTIADFNCVTTVSSLAVMGAFNSEKCANVMNWMSICRELPCCSSDEQEFEHFKKFLRTIMS